MRIKYLIPFLVLVLIFGFGLISCDESSAENKIVSELGDRLVDRNLEIESLKSELDTTKNQLKLADEKIEEMENANTEIIEEESTEETKSAEEIKEDTRDIFEEVIEVDLGGQLTKFVLDDSDDNPKNWIAYISYNTKWAKEDTVKKGMYTIVDFYAQSLFGIFYELDLTATTKFGDNYNCFNSREFLGKIYNYEIDYSEWLNTTFK